MRRSVGFGRGTAQVLGFRRHHAELAQGFVGDRYRMVGRRRTRRGRRRGLGGRRAFLIALALRELVGLVLDPPDCVFQRQTLARDLGFVERRVGAAQLIDQRSARALVQRTADFAGAVVEARNGARDQRIVFSHCAST